LERKVEGAAAAAVFGMPEDKCNNEMFRRLIRLQKHSPIINKMT
jgi:hypothetical protein